MYNNINRVQKYYGEKVDKLPSDTITIKWKKFTLLEEGSSDELTEMISSNSLLKITKDMKLHVGDTNFKLTKRIAEIINNHDGIEYFRVITPYKFIVGVGECFLDSLVKRNLEVKMKKLIK